MQTFDWTPAAAALVILAARYAWVVTRSAESRQSIDIRREWARRVMAQPGLEIVAVQTLRNSIMAATLMATTATLALMGVLTLGHAQMDTVAAAPATGVIDFLTRAAQDGYLGPHGARLFVGVRTMQDALCLPQIGALRERFDPALEVTVALSETGVGAAERSRWPGIRFSNGMVHESVASDLPDRTGNTMAFLAGPPAMVDATRRVLMLQGRMAPSRIRFDKFT